MISHSTELYFVASLMARPELIQHVLTQDIQLESPTANAALSVLAKYGSTYASPSAMMVRLSDLPVELDVDEVSALVTLVPPKDEVSLASVLEQRNQILESQNTRRLRIALAEASYREDPVSIATAAEKALTAFRMVGLGKDQSAAAIIERMSQGQQTVRWRATAGIRGGEIIDNQVIGLHPNRKQTAHGILGSGEVTLLVAKYGVGKTRIALNWVISLLSQGASVDLVVGEDNEATYSAKLMAIRAGVPKWKIETYIVPEIRATQNWNSEDVAAIEEAIEWFKGLNLRIYDGAAKKNIFNIDNAVALLEESAAVYHTTHVIVDYVQIWKGDTQKQEENAQRLRAFAARSNVGLLLLSQLPGEAIKGGVAADEVPTKGSTEWGQIAHWAYVVSYNPMFPQELMIRQTKGRDGGLNLFYCHIDPRTSKILEYYGTPKFGQIEEDELERPKRRTRK